MSRSNAVRPSWPMRCFARSSLACPASQSIAGWPTGISPWIRSCSASIKMRINPLSCPAAFSMAPLAC
eukprot:2709876-Alexandrium_andersonii.AAC.1